MSASADHRVPVHLFQNDTLLCRPAGRIARALQGCCWAELGLEVKVSFTAQCKEWCRTTTLHCVKRVARVCACSTTSSGRSDTQLLSSQQAPQQAES
jgi:hypothetical protein